MLSGFGFPGSGPVEWGQTENRALDMPLVTVPKALRHRLGEDGADALVALINAASDHNKADVLAFVEEKFERRLSQEVAKLDVRISELRADLVRWMFIFWVAQLGAILATLFAFFRK